MFTTNQKHRVSLYIDPLMVIRAKAQALVENTTLTDLVEKALIAYLPSQIIIK